MRTSEEEPSPASFKGLDQFQQILARLGLFLSGIAFAGGIAGLVYVVINVQSTSPPSFGSQGEWLYGGAACLLVAGWGFSQAAKFFARLRTAAVPEDDDLLTPKIQIGSDGVSIELPPLKAQNAAARRSPGTLTWSFTSSPTPIKTFGLDEAQLAAAEEAVRRGADWDAVCRLVNPAYETLSEVEQSLYRRALQSAIEDRRARTRG